MGTVLGIDEGTRGATYGLRKHEKTYVTDKTYSLTYIVLADNTSESEDAILTSTGVPILWGYYNGTYCKKLAPKEKSSIFRHPVTGVKTILWYIKADFDSKLDPDQDEPPTSKPPTVRWHGETEEEVLEKDPITGDAVQTGAEEVILITTPIVLPVLEITRYENYPFDPDTMLAYAHHTNSTTFWGAPPGSALMMPMAVDEEVIETVRYARVTYKIKFKIKKDGATMSQDTWKARVLHHGFKYREAAAEDPVIFQDKHGNPTTVNLKADGTRVAKGDPALYLEFNRFTKANFNNLSLGPF